MKGALLLALALLTGCSGSSQPVALPTPTPTASPSPVTTQPLATRTPVATTASPTVGPVGTKVPKGFAPTSATFISDRTGWVLGASPCPSGKGSCDVIARTRDGGATWRAIPSPATTPEHLAQVRFADERNGYVTGDQLWATHDGGATWKVVPGVEDVTQLAAAAGRVWVTDNQELTSAPVGGGAFVTEMGDVTAFVLNRDLVVYTSSRAELKLYAAKHGGNGADAVEVPCAQADGPVLGLGSTSHWFLVCEGDAGLGHQDKEAFESFDAGTTWKSAGKPPPLTGTDIYVTSDGDFVIDHQEVAVYRGGTWKVALTTDGGLSEGGFESARLGFCIGGFDGAPDLRMKLTQDAGRTWSTVTF